MKKITIDISDETAEIFDILVQSRDYCKYPRDQAYGLIIDETVAELNRLSKMPVFTCCPSILSSISYEDIVFSCALKKKRRE